MDNDNADQQEEGGQMLVSRPRIRSVLERYYRTFLVKDNGGPGEDYLVHIHTNRAMIATLAPSHVLIRALRESLVSTEDSASVGSGVAGTGAGAMTGAKRPLFIVSWNWRHHVIGLVPRTTARGNPTLAPGEVGAKRQRSSAPKIPCFQKDSILATAITNDGRAWPIRAGVRGYPTEVNQRFFLTSPPTAGAAPGSTAGGSSGSSSSAAPPQPKTGKGGGGRWVKAQERVATAAVVAAASAASAAAASSSFSSSTASETTASASGSAGEAVKTMMHVDGDEAAAAAEKDAGAAGTTSDAVATAAPVAATSTAPVPPPPSSKPKKAATPEQLALTALLRDRTHSDAFVAIFCHPNRHKAAAMPFEAPGLLVSDFDAFLTSGGGLPSGEEETDATAAADPATNPAPAMAAAAAGSGAAGAGEA